MFAVNHNAGFRMTFANGVTVSVQFKHGNYCNRRYEPAHLDADLENTFTESVNAEVAIWHGGDSLTNSTSLVRQYRRGACDDVLGWQTPDEVAAMITWAQNWTRERGQSPADSLAPALG